MIEIDIPHKTLNAQLTDEEIRQRLDALPEFEPKVKTGYLARYTQMVSSADRGAVFQR
jgi:dihydroxy-acid dehydratase